MCVRHRARADLACISNWGCFLTIGTLSELSRPSVLRLNRAQPPSTSAQRGGACRFLQPRTTHCHPAFPVATAPKVCSTFAVCVSISIFASVCAVVLLPSMLPPHNPLCWLLRITMWRWLLKIFRQFVVAFSIRIEPPNGSNRSNNLLRGSRKMKLLRQSLDRL